MSDSLKKQYVELLVGHIDSPETFIESCAYSILSSTIGRQYHYLHPDTVHPFRPNTFFMLSCIPGRGRRSSVLNNWNYTYKKTLTNYYRGLETDKDIDDLIDATKFTGGSCQGVVDHIEEAIGLYNVNEFVNFNTEYSSTIKLMAPGKYSEGLGFLKCMLYYGEEWSEDLSQRGKSEEKRQKSRRRIREGLYVNSITGMQEIQKVLHSGISDNGYLRREIIVYEDEFDMNGWKPPLREPGGKTINLELDDFSLSLSDKMINNEKLLKENQQKAIQLRLYPKVLDAINQIARLDDTKISNKNRENIDIIRQTRWEHLLKLSMLEAIARSDVKVMEINGVGSELYIDVLPQDEINAYTFLEKVHKNDKAISDALEEKKPYKTRTVPFDEITDFICSDNDGKTATEVYNKFHRKYDDLEDLLIKLQKSGRIVLSQEKRNRTGPEAFVYRKMES